jgi:hypothetical protein
LNRKNKKSGLKPVTFFDELAEYGCLEEYLNTFFPDKMKYDGDFSSNMKAKLEHFPDIELNLTDLELMEKISSSLTYFLENIKPWKQETA